MSKIRTNYYMAILKPCPCCKDAWIFALVDDSESGYESNGYRVNCHCGYAWEHSDWHKTREEAAEAWNRA